MNYFFSLCVELQRPSELIWSYDASYVESSKIYVFFSTEFHLASYVPGFLPASAVVEFSEQTQIFPVFNASCIYLWRIDSPLLASTGGYLCTNCRTPGCLREYFTMIVKGEWGLYLSCHDAFGFNCLLSLPGFDFSGLFSETWPSLSQPAVDYFPFIASSRGSSGG